MPAQDQTKLPEELEQDIAVKMARGELSIRKGVDYALERGFTVSRETIRSAFRRQKAWAFQQTGVTDITQSPAKRSIVPVPVIPQVPTATDFKAEEDRINQMVEILRAILKREIEDAGNYRKKGDKVMAYSMYRNAKVTIMHIVRACTDKAHMRQFNFTFIKNEGGVNIQAEQEYKRGFDEGFRAGMEEGVAKFREFIRKEEDANAPNGNDRKQAV